MDDEDAHVRSIAAKMVEQMVLEESKHHREVEWEFI